MSRTRNTRYYMQDDDVLIFVDFISVFAKNAICVKWKVDVSFNHAVDKSINTTGGVLFNINDSSSLNWQHDRS